MSQPMPPFPPAPPAPKGKGPLFWILLVVGGVVLMGMLVIGAGIFFVGRTLSQAGVSLQDFRDNPALAMSKVVTATNPDLEVLDVDDDTGTISVRNKQTGETTTIRFDAANRRMVVVDGEGNEVSTFEVNGDGKTGKVEINANGENATFTASPGGELPSWVPVYPGTQPEGTLRAETSEGLSQTFTFKNPDTTEEVFDFYRERLPDEGLEITTQVTQQTGGMLVATDDANGRQIVITMSATGDTVMNVTERE